jgi:hypothetical protein
VPPSETVARPPTPIYKSTLAYTPLPVRVPVLPLATSTPPPIPSWNHPRPNTTVSPCTTAPHRIYPQLADTAAKQWSFTSPQVTETTWTQQANTRSQLTPPNPFYLDHTVWTCQYAGNTRYRPATPLHISDISTTIFHLMLAPFQKSDSRGPHSAELGLYYGDRSVKTSQQRIIRGSSSNLTLCNSLHDHIRFLSLRVWFYLYAHRGVYRTSSDMMA